MKAFAAIVLSFTLVACATLSGGLSSVELAIRGCERYVKATEFITAAVAGGAFYADEVAEIDGIKRRLDAYCTAPSPDHVEDVAVRRGLAELASRSSNERTTARLVFGATLAAELVRATLDTARPDLTGPPSEREIKRWQEMQTALIAANAVWRSTVPLAPPRPT